MSHNRKSRFALAVIALAALTGVTAARSVGVPAREPFAGDLLALAGTLVGVGRSLELTAAQKRELTALVGDEQPRIEPRLDAVLAARRSLFDAVHTEGFDEAAIRDAADRLAAAEVELALERAHAVERARALLTEPQRVRLATARERVMSELGEHVARLRLRLRAAAPRWIELL